MAVSVTILLDNQPLSLDAAPADATLADALDRAREQLDGTELMVFGVCCDGDAIGPQSLDDAMNRPLDTWQSVEFSSAHPKDVVIEALKQTRTALSDTFPAIRQAAQLLAGGNVSEAMSAMVRCLAVWGRTHEAIVQGAALIAVDFEAVIVDRRPLLDWIQDLARGLRELKSTIESRDFVLLGDVLRYELDATLQGWERMLDGLIEHVESKPAAPDLRPAAVVP
jgi:hypothetical protein